ncbi:MAG: GMP synthase (glutamine-hydrolyzing) [Candidatus Jordarchaeum sp.]|uniref:GMP synthase (glutamine-hydrolyzing) n=1 Tax=Candidatus Jordarchaeum sp. TaxID=2823881 RepID=UPI0040492CCF
MFDAKQFIEEQVERIRQEVGAEKAMVAASGGVDSSVTTVLGFKALKDKLTVVFLDNGLMREGEPEAVVKVFKDMGIKTKLYDVKKNFFQAMNNLTDPEEKRKAFRQAFYKSLARIARQLGVRILLQGTIAADISETVRGVKSQHNVLEQIGINPLQEFGYRIIEPIKELYKPEVRQVAKELKLPDSIVNRKPFPGPALSVRVIGEIKPEKVEMVRKATKIVEEESNNFPSFQIFAVLLNDRATGLTDKGERAYGNIIVIRAVDSRDAMTAEATKMPWDRLLKMEKRIISEIPGVSRVLYDLTSKPPATIEFE